MMLGNEKGRNSPVRSVRVLMFGAHPDDCEFECSGLAALVTQAGGTVGFVSATDGSSGHHQMAGAELVERRRLEAEAGAAVVRASVTNLGFTDGWLFADRALREAVISTIRTFEPDVVVCPRPSDYHPDHRAIATAVQDAGYLLMVPGIVPDVPVSGKRPIILHVYDPFTEPRPFRPDIVVDIDPVVERKIDAILAHESQVREWLPHINGFAADVPAEEPARTQFLRQRERSKANRIAEKYATHLRERYGRTPSAAEAYEISEYGASVEADQVYELLGLLQQ
ncbi:PIG-L family deacetylase [Tessaracoccus sp. OH4464_COT-324]|nr:PIG-L family deacetylase [Tessaracoccus sp. OH4464_COT-324]